MKKILFGLLAAASLMTSCKKESSFEVNSGNGPGAGGDYQPNAKGSYWKYKEDGAFSGETTLTSTGQTKTINGIPVVLFTGTSTSMPGSSDGYYGKKDHNYYTIVSGSSPNTGAAFDMSFLYLNDTASVGYTWTHNAGQGNGFSAIIDGAIVERDIIIQVAGKTYKDVIHTSFDLSYDIPVIGKLPFATYDYYVAKNIGIVQIETKTNPLVGASVQTLSNLVQYSIK